MSADTAPVPTGSSPSDVGPSTLQPSPGISAGERFVAPRSAGLVDGQFVAGLHVWNTLGFRRMSWAPGRTVIGWDAGPEYCFATAGGPVVQGGLVTAILDAAMGGATWSVLDNDQAFLTADIRVEFLRSATPGELCATGVVVRRTRSVLFAAAELHDAAGRLLAVARATQAVLASSGRHER